MFQIRYGLGGGFGGPGDWEYLPGVTTMEQAEEAAYEAACETYESYDGMYGLRSVEQIAEEDGISEDEALETWREERETWLDYEAREV